jgi:hypothetical protein
MVLSLTPLHFIIITVNALRRIAGMNESMGCFTPGYLTQITWLAARVNSGSLCSERYEE